MSNYYRYNNRRKNRLKIIFILILIILSSMISIYLFLNINNDKKSDVKNVESKKEDVFSDEIKYNKEAKPAHLVSKKNGLDIMIRYPNFNYKKLDEKIYYIISDYEQKFKNENKQKLPYMPKLYIDYESFKYKNILTVNFYIKDYSYSLKLPYEKIDTYYFDYKTGKQLDKDEVFNNGYKTVLSKLCDKFLQNDQEYYKFNETRLYKQRIGLEHCNSIALDEKNVVIKFLKGELLNRNLEIVIPIKNIKSFLKIGNNFITDVSLKDDKDNLVITDKPLLALTFDDGPSIHTKKLLDALQKYDAHASFFLVGRNIESFKNEVKREFLEGHDVANHTLNHPLLSKLTKDQIFKEINTTDVYISEIIGRFPMYLRPPYGGVNDDVIKIANRPLIFWNIDTEDWKYKDKAKVKKAIIDGAADGNIILMHDIHETTVDAVIELLPELTKKYKLVSVSELLKTKGIVPSRGEKIFNAK